jgi:hypothetical protein
MLAMVAVSAMSAMAAAQTAAPAQPKQQGPVASACHADVQRLCAGVKPGEGRIRACVHQHQQELSPGCKTAISNHRGGQQPAKI